MLYFAKRIFVVYWLVKLISQRGYLLFTEWQHSLVKVLSLKEDICPLLVGNILK